ncbi:CAP domain-containing protein [Levilactobacillus suantsaiihabitans]|uniref:SCP domain-containing protein n=1 Tax=Levilactobacillus suantsaiihabitans TaxID=2487722 RepID=A0A4Z0J7X0_9LACO|nr:CAP domain-containing protein [Levilactobacillus suantsaiihabitans]TGD17973.1 hypothetical protein EGT51_10395 [Levilactobacillus suantsaiihabitans]
MNKRLKKSLLVSVAALSLGVEFTVVNETATTTVMAAKKYKVVKTKKLKKYRVSYKHNGPVYRKANLSKKRTTLKKIKKDKLYVTKQETVRKHTKKGKAYNSRYLYVKDMSHSKKSGWIHNSNLKKYKKSSKKSQKLNWTYESFDNDSSEKNVKSYSYSQGVQMAKRDLIKFIENERAKAGVSPWIHDSGAQQVADIRAQQVAQLKMQSHYTDPETGKIVTYPNSSSKMPMFNKVETDLGFLNDPWDNSMLTHSDESITQFGRLTNEHNKITKDSIQNYLDSGAEGMITFDGASNNGHKKQLLSSSLVYYGFGMATTKDQDGDNVTYIVIISSAAPLTKTNASDISSNSTSSTTTAVDPNAIPRSQDDKNYVGSSAQKADQAKEAQLVTTQQ